jgi:hypothetical protein
MQGQRATLVIFGGDTRGDRHARQLATPGRVPFIGADHGYPLDFPGIFLDVSAVNRQKAKTWSAE